MSTLSDKLELTIPEGPDLLSRAIIANNFQTIDDKFGTVICTSGTRPSTPFPGQVIYETDTRFVYIRNAANTSWSMIANIPSVTIPSVIASPYAGQVVFVTGDNEFYRYTGSAWTLFSMFSKSANNTVSTQESTASTSYTDLSTSGPAVTLASVGNQALVTVRTQVFGSTATFITGHMGFTVSGATSRAAADSDSLGMQCNNAAGGNWITGSQLISINAGTNTYTAKYKAVNGTAVYAARRIWVFAP